MSTIRSAILFMNGLGNRRAEIEAIIRRFTLPNFV